MLLTPHISSSLNINNETQKHALAPINTKTMPHKLNYMVEVKQGPSDEVL